MPTTSVKTCAAVGTGSVTAHVAGLSPLQALAVGIAVLAAAVLLKLLVLEWFSRKGEGVRSDVLKFASMLFLGREAASAPDVPASRKRRARRRRPR
ncbi:hypothetical protein LO771_11590 [Streptacidiphilus sp. ASG 303]|uniref:hypothetical protein n=1 Tax=Streptacidiphilus sp. ASG 303 TaxID=2896847 RepID=UPI001E58ADAB|nr:hypothetical protein [Streptacidiphilus sp. ASG 303]MCD0483026.1 hypothetical protein [Streptacidiphilus sp. ASG 303]